MQTQIIFNYIPILSTVLFLQTINAINNIRWKSSDILPNDYDPNIAPVLDGKGVQVNIEVTILSLMPSTGTEMTFDVDLFFNQYWNDYRLQTPSGLPKNKTEKIILNSWWNERLWTPDTVFSNAIKGNVANILSPSLYFIITNQTNVLMSARLQMKLSCDMDFKRYPFDSQICPVSITTLSDSIDDVVLCWKGFRLGNRLNLPQYQLENGLTEHCTREYEKGTFSCLTANIHFKRNIGKFIIKRYIPSFLIVIMSFAGFWIPTSSSPARVTLIVTALLALIAQQIQNELNITYIYALEVWTILCISFVFAVLIEYALAIAYDRMSVRKNSMAIEKLHSKFIGVKIGPNNSIVDMVSRYFFPAVFVAAVILYFVIYLFYVT